jgi:hypothetical protein
MRPINLANARLLIALCIAIGVQSTTPARAQGDLVEIQPWILFRGLEATTC